MLEYNKNDLYIYIYIYISGVKISVITQEIIQNKQKPFTTAASVSFFLKRIEFFQMQNVFVTTSNGRRFRLHLRTRHESNERWKDTVLVAHALQHKGAFVLPCQIYNFFEKRFSILLLLLLFCLSVFK